MKFLLCSKYKYWDQWAEIKSTLEKNGHKCITPLDIDLRLFGKSGLEINETQYLEAVREYYRELQAADALYVLNYEGELGKSMMQEIGYATALKKPIFCLESYYNEPSLALFVTDIKKADEI